MPWPLCCSRKGLFQSYPPALVVCSLLEQNTIFHPFSNSDSGKLCTRPSAAAGDTKLPSLCPHGIHSKSKDNYNSGQRGIEEDHPSCSVGWEEARQTCCSLLKESLLPMFVLPELLLDSSVLFLSTSWLQGAFVANKQHLCVL